ncbi:hypothetical protein Emag_005744 [Eimeria magna]
MASVSSATAATRGAPRPPRERPSRKLTQQQQQQQQEQQQKQQIMEQDVRAAKIAGPARSCCPYSGLPSEDTLLFPLACRAARLHAAAASASRTFAAALPRAAAKAATTATAAAAAPRAATALLPQQTVEPVSIIAPRKGSSAFAGGSAAVEVAGAGHERALRPALTTGVDPARNNLCLRSLLSRQLLVWGPQQQEVLPRARVLIIGAGAAAAEAGKCLLQSGVGCLLLADPETPDPAERAASFAVAAHAEEQAAAAAAATAAAAAVPTDTGTTKGSHCGLSKELQRTRHQQQQQQQQQQHLTRAAIVCAALRRLAAPFAQVNEVSLQQQDGESAAEWRERLLRLMQQVDVVLLCDRPLQQKVFFADLVRHIRQQREQVQQQQQQTGAGPVVVAVCTAGLTGRIAADFGDFSFFGGPEEAALSALLQKHAQPQQKQQQQQQQQPQQQQQHMTRLIFPSLRDVLTSAAPGQQEQQLDQQQLLPAAAADTRQQILAAAFEALDEAEAEGLGAGTAQERLASETGSNRIDDRPHDAAAAAAAAGGNLRSWKSARIGAASRVASRAAAIWRHRYGSAAAAAAAAECPNEASPAAAVAAAEAAVANGAEQAARLGALMVVGAAGQLAPIAAAMGALAAQEALKALTHRYRPLQRPFVLHALDLLDLTSPRCSGSKATSSSSSSGSSSNCSGRSLCPTGGSSAKNAEYPACGQKKAAAYVEGGGELPATAAASAAAATAPQGEAATPSTSPWEGQQRVLGRRMQERLQHLRVMLVGAGAIGCEILKNLALMGVSAACGEGDDAATTPGFCTNSCNHRRRGSLVGRLLRLLCSYKHSAAPPETPPPLAEIEEAAAAAAAPAAADVSKGEKGPCKGGLLTVVDGDSVEVSNLSRQMLFTVSSLAQAKASAAAAAAARLCSRMRLQAHSFMLSKENLWLLPPLCMQQQDLLIAALDSVEARLLVDSLCLLHSKPWVEAGTLGLRGHSQSLVPHLTEPYGAAVPVGAAAAGADASVPVCSVRGAPTTPLHAVHWALALLQQVFKAEAAAAHLLLQQLLHQHCPPFANAGLALRGSGTATRAGSEAVATSDSAAVGTSQAATQQALRILGMAPAAVSAAAAGFTQLERMLLLAHQVLLSQPNINLSGELSQQVKQQQPHNESKYGIIPQTATHLRLVSFGLSLYKLMFEASSQQGGGAVDEPTMQKRELPLKIGDADTLDFIGAAAQLLAASLGLEARAAATQGAAAANSKPDSPLGAVKAAAAALEQQEADELLLRGQGVGPWSRQSVAEALQRLLSGSPHASWQPPLVESAAAAADRLRSAAAALQQNVAAAATVKREALRAPVTPPLSPDEAVPLRFLTAAARLHCRRFGLLPLPEPAETQQLLGRIVPATATATTLAAALACLEVYRLVALGLAGSPAHRQQQHQQQQQQHKQQQQRGSPTLWLDRGSLRYRRAALSEQQRLLRNSFFSLSVPFVMEAPPLPPPALRFTGGRWRRQHFSPWTFWRLGLRGVAGSKDEAAAAAAGAAAGEAEAAEMLTISQLVRLVERDAGVRVRTLTAEDRLLYAAPGGSGSSSEEPDPQHQQAVLPAWVEDLFGKEQQQEQPLPDPQLPVAECLRQMLSQQRRNSNRKQQQQEGERWVWSVVVIEARDSSGEEAALPPLKVLLKV